MTYREGDKVLRLERELEEAGQALAHARIENSILTSRAQGAVVINKGERSSEVFRSTAIGTWAGIVGGMVLWACTSSPAMSLVGTFGGLVAGLIVGLIASLDRSPNPPGEHHNLYLR